MALPAFDADKHHVSLGGFGFILDGAYRKHEQSEGTPSEYGGDRDLVAEPGLARWTQDSFVGGQYQYTWDDPAMVRSCRGMMPSVYEDSLRSVPFVSGVWGASYAEAPLAWFVVDGKFVLVFPTLGIKVVDPDTGAEFASESWFTNIQGVYTFSFFDVAGYDPSDKYLYVIYKATNQSQFYADDEHVIFRYKFDWTVAEPDRIQHVPSASGTTIVPTWGWEIPDTLCVVYPATSGFRPEDREPIVASLGQGTAVFTFGAYVAGLIRPFGKIGDVDGTSTYWTLESGMRLPSRVVAITLFNGLHYILVSDDQQWVTQLFTWDGTTLHSVIEFPYSFQARCITPYGGRLFVGGAAKGPDGSDDVYGELYEVSGETLRLVRTFAPEYRNSAVESVAPSAIEQLAVFEGLLWFYNSVTKHFECYDLARDAFYGGPRLGDANISPADDDWQLVGLRAFRDNLYVYVFDPTDATDRGMCRITTSDLEAIRIAEGVQPTEWEVVTSDFMAEPARDKAFSTLKVLTRYGEVASAEYSTDGAITFSSLPETDTETSGTLVTTTFDASAIKSRQVCFRFRGVREDGNGDLELDGYTELIAFTVSFAFLDTGFKVWQFTIQGAEQTELLDGETFLQDVSEMADQLWDWKANGTKLSFVDLDGSTQNVRIVDISEQMPYIGPRLPDEGRPEAFFQLVLAEV